MPVTLPPGALPGGASGLTYWPLRGMKTPHATAFLDSGYFRGYPNLKGEVTEPALKGYWHTGVDMNGPGACNSDKGDALYAIRDGVIEWQGNGGGSWGKVVVLRVVVDGKTYWCRYGHVQNTAAPKSQHAVQVVAGQSVRAREVIAFIGSGSWKCAHLHFDVFHTRPPSWGWWPTRNGSQSEVTRYCTDPDAFLRRLRAVSP